MDNYSKYLFLLMEAILETNLWYKEQAKKTNTVIKKVDLGRFLRDKDPYIFVNSEYQKTFSQIPFSEIEKVVQEAILKYTIGALGGNKASDLSNRIPEFLQKWIDNKNRSFHFVYEEIINNPYHTNFLVETLLNADYIYKSAQADMEKTGLTPYKVNLINKLEQERQMLKDENMLSKENSNYNVDALIEAYESTDQVFQSRGAQPGKIDLGLYLKEGNTGCFTRQNNVRSKIMAIPFEDMETDVKKALLEGAIAIFGTKFNPKEDFKNQIPNLFLDWINYNNSTIYQSKTFEDLYQEIISNVNLYPNLIQTLKASKDRYLLARDNYLSGDTLEPGTKEVISVLEEEKDNLFTSKTR